MSMLSLYLLAPIFLAPTEEGPAVMTPDGLAWHQIDAGAARDFTIPRRGQVVALVRRIKPSEGAAKVTVTIKQGDKELWTTTLEAGRGAQLGRVVAGRASRGTSKDMAEMGKIAISAPGQDHQGILVQLELIPDLGTGATDAVAARSEAGAADLAAKPGLAPTGGLSLDTPALVAPASGAPGAESAITVAKASPDAAPKAPAAPKTPAAGTPAQAPEKAATTAAAPAAPAMGDKAGAAAAGKKPFFLSAADGGLGMRQVWGGLMQNNASFRVGADLRQAILPNITIGLEMRLAFLSAEGNAAIPLSGMTASATSSTVRRTNIGGWAMPLLVRLTQTGNSGLQTVLLVGPAFGGLTVTPGSHPAQSHSMSGMATVVRLQPKSGIALGPTQLRIGAELGWQGLWGDKVSASRGFAGVDLGFPWSL